MEAVSGWFRWELFQAGSDGSCFRLEEMGWFRWKLFQGGLDGSCLGVI